MKKSLLSLAFACFLFSAAKAQLDDPALKALKLDLSIGYAKPSGTGAKGGILFAAEPKYGITDNFYVGLRLEGTIMARGYESSNSSSTSNDVEVKVSNSYLATADYYFTSNRSFRPFVGVGAGLHKLAAVAFSNNTSASDASYKFGGMGRLGFETGHFRLGVEYNWIPDSEFTYSYLSTSYKSTSKNAYIGFKVGYFLGGNKK